VNLAVPINIKIASEHYLYMPLLLGAEVEYRHYLYRCMIRSSEANPAALVAVIVFLL
jgi:hypothetical protein